MNRETADFDDERWEQAGHMAELIAAYIRQTLTPAGHDELSEWINKDPANMRLFEELTDEGNQEKARQWMQEIDVEKALEKVSGRIEALRKPIKKINTWRYIAAAAVLVAIALSAEFIYTVSRQPIKTEQASITRQDTISTGGNHATLRLSNGKLLVLDSLQNGIIYDENETQIEKDSTGVLVYNAPVASHVNDDHAYNTLTTPVGGEYMLVLQDGTKAWLNAGSSLQYPVAFSTTGTRKVYMTGEVYFEVAKDPSRPFVVGFNSNDTVEVLGTHFSISAFGDDLYSVVSLFEGSVKTNNQLLRPGQQLRKSRSTGESTVVNNIDETEEIAWKNGFFDFQDQPIEHIMRVLARWYTIELNFTGNIKEERFTFTASRKDNINTILYKLERTGTIHFKIKGKKITISR